MQTIPDITVGSLAWVDLNTVSDIAVGAKFSVTNKDANWVRLIESTLAPSLDSTDGELLSIPPSITASRSILTGSLKIWALCANKGLSSKVSIQML
jgi:hypothetical protein